ncbi:MAG: hypothetical protein K9N07_06265 [Candidatus Cloacimonetes bacterium]|nr:hypothetical protein [Candidatus Cloacimonadota bacterium]
MKKIVGFIYILAFFITGCTEDGVLRVHNRNADYGWYIIDSGLTMWLQPGEYDEKNYGLSKSIFGEEEKNVTVEYGGEYVFPMTVNKTIRPGSTTTLQFETNAGGIEIWNDSNSFYITEVYLSPSSETTWGANDLNGEIGPSEWQTWYVSPGYWDIQVVDNYDDVFIAMNEYITLETTSVFYYNGFRKSKDPALEKLINSSNFSIITEDKVEQQ